MVDIEETIRATMTGAHQAPQPPRDLKPFLMSANEILRADIPKKKFLVSTFIPSASFGMVFAPRGIGKSWFAFGLGKAIATGVDAFLGWQIHEQGDVLFVDGEMSMVDLKERTKLLFGSEGSSRFHLLPSEELYKNGCPICLDMPNEHRAILDLLNFMRTTEKNPKLIILDNLSTLRRGINENDNSETEKLLSFLIQLRHMGYAVLLVHHTNKAGEQRGASIIEVPMDYIIKLSAPDKTDAFFRQGASFVVEFSKVRNKPPKNRDFLCELLETPNGNLDFAINTSITEVPDETALLRAIAECDVKPNVRLLSNRLGFSNGKISKLMGILRKEHTLIAGTYALTETGKCKLHEWFPQSYPKPDSYKNYQEDIPF